MATNKAVAKKEPAGVLAGITGAQPISKEARKQIDEERTKDDYAIPFLRPLQSNSPQVNERDSAYVAGAKAGMLYDTVTEEIYDGTDGVYVIPIAYKRSFIEWKPREEGGGFIAEHTTSEGLTLEKTGEREGGKTILPNGHELHDTRSWFCYLINKEGEYHPVLIPMSSTNIATSRKWLYYTDNAKKPGADGGKVPASYWELVYHLTTAYRENDKGNWYVLKVKPIENGWVQDKQILESAQEFANNVSEGSVKVEHQAYSPGEDDEESVAF